MRQVKLERVTNETKIVLELNLDGRGDSDISTGIGFFDHMLTALAKHAGFDLAIRAEGDLYVDDHHTVEDVGIVLGSAIDQALGDRRGIHRFGEATVPMDEALSFAALDLSGRPWLAFKAAFSTEKIGDLSSQMVGEFFKAVAFNGRLTLHLTVLAGENDHHKAEALFKAFARSMACAVRKTLDRPDEILSTKGVL